MRCNECKVDLPEFYKKCPLCGCESTNEEPMIPDIMTAEYPKVKTEPVRINPFPVFIIIWAVFSVLSFILFKKNIINNSAFVIISSLPPVIWTLFLRPIFIRQYYKGNYIVMNLFSFGYTLLLAEIVLNLSAEYLNIFSVTFVSFIIVGLFIMNETTNKEHMHRIAPYCVLLLFYSIISALLIFLFKDIIPYLWLIPILLCVFAFIRAYKKSGFRTIEELKAKFSIQ